MTNFETQMMNFKKCGKTAMVIEICHLKFVILSRWIVAAGMKRVATGDSREAAQCAPNRAVFSDGQDEVIAAGGLEAAVPADQRAQRPLIDSRRQHEQVAR
jgi:hypothetical protein